MNKLFKVNTNYLNLRAGSGINYLTLTKIPKGAIIRYLNEFDNYWVKVKYKNYIGWVSKDYITSLENKTNYFLGEVMENTKIRYCKNNNSTIKFI